MDKYITYAHKDKPNGTRYRDIAGKPRAEYPVWAVDFREEKELNGNLRQPYYKAADGLWELRDVLKGDEELFKLVLQAQEALLKLETAMSEKYIWD